MNRIYRTLWNAVRQCFVVANEKTGVSQSCGSGLSLGRGRESAKLTVAQASTRSCFVVLKSLTAFAAASMFALPSVYAATHYLKIGGVEFSGESPINVGDGWMSTDAGDVTVSRFFSISTSSSGSGTTNKTITYWDKDGNEKSQTISVSGGSVTKVLSHNGYDWGISYGGTVTGYMNYTFNFTDVAPGSYWANSIKTLIGQKCSKTKNHCNPVITFSGTDTGKTVSEGKLTSTNFNSIVASSDGALFKDTVFESDKTDLKIGSSTGINGSVGFKRLNNASTVQVLSGKELTLLGDGSVVTAAALTLNSGGSLVLGSKSITGTQGGTVKAIANSGGVKVVKGSFSIASLTGNGSLVMDEGSEITSPAAITAGASTINGSLNAANGFESSDDVVLGNTGSISASTFKSKGFNIGDGRIIVKNLVSNTLKTIGNRITSDKFNSESLSVAGSVVIGTADDGVSDVFSKEMTLTGALDAGGSVQVDNGSSLKTGSVKAEHLNVGGAIDTGKINSGAITVDSSGSVISSDNVISSGALAVNGTGKLVGNAVEGDSLVTDGPIQVGGSNDAATVRGKVLRITKRMESKKNIHVASGGFLKAGSVKTSTDFKTDGTVQTESVLAKNVNISNTGTLIVDKLGGSLNQTIINKGVVLASSAGNVGLVQIQPGASLVVGSANIEAYYLMNLNLAKEVYENGGTLSQTVVNALINAGEIVNPASLPVPEDGEQSAADGEGGSDRIASGSDERADNPDNSVAADADEAGSDLFSDTRYAPGVDSILQTGGSLYEAVRLSEEAHRTVLDHGLTAGPSDSSLWAKGVYAKIDTDSFESDTTGFAFGADGLIGDIRIGAAFTAQRADVDGMSTSNDIDAYSFSLYAAKSVAWGMNLVGGVTYTRTNNDLSSMGIKGKAKIDAMLAGARLTKPFDIGTAFTLTPYVGADAGVIRAKGFNLRIEGADPFAVQKVTEWFGRLPVGVKADKRFSFSDGFLKIGADASYTQQIGSKSVDHHVEGFEYNEVMSDRYLGSLNLNAAYERGNASFTLEYGMTKGNIRDVSHSVSAKAQLMF